VSVLNKLQLKPPLKCWELCLPVTKENPPTKDLKQLHKTPPNLAFLSLSSSHILRLQRFEVEKPVFFLMPGNVSADVLDRSEALKCPQTTKIFISTKPWAKRSLE